ncbi:MAG: hypothetical protein JNM27_14945 [Leptospirales bacterium]|nr:hypothetical protein [Leptospirales bacterium]
MSDRTGSIRAKYFPKNGAARPERFVQWSMRRLLPLLVLPMSLTCLDSPGFLAFVTRAAIPVLKYASTKSPSLAVAEPGDRIMMRGRSNGYMHVDLANGQTGYIPEEEAEARKNVAVFRAESWAAAGIVHTATVMRQKPMPDADVIRTLPVDARLRIDAVSNLDESIGSERGQWLQVAVISDSSSNTPSHGVNSKRDNSESKKGYVFSAAVLMGSEADVKAYETGAPLSLSERPAMLAAYPQTYAIQEDGKPRPIDSRLCTVQLQEATTLPGPGALILVNAFRQVNSRKYLSLANVYCKDSKDTNGNQDSVTPWIPASQARMISDIFAYTQNFRPEIPRSLKQQINQAMGGLDVRDMEVWQIPSSDGRGRTLVRAWRGHCYVASDSVTCREGFYFEKKGDTYSLIGRFTDPMILDMDGNGVVEVITQLGGRGGPTYELYTWQGDEKQFVGVPLRSEGEPMVGSFWLKQVGRQIIAQADEYVQPKDPEQPGSYMTVTSLVQYRGGKITFTPISRVPRKN